MINMETKKTINVEISSPLLGTQGIVSNTYKDQAYQLIKDAIIYRKLQVGNVYPQDALCSELGISRTPVREALIELQKEGYIEILRGRGIRIIPMTRKEALDIIEMRYYIEILGSQLAAQRRTIEDIEMLENVFNEMKSVEDPKNSNLLYKLDRKIHRCIFEIANNGWLQSTNENLREHFLRVENQKAFDINSVMEEHLKVVNAIKSGDHTAAGNAMQFHMESSKKRTMLHIIGENSDSKF